MRQPGPRRRSRSRPRDGTGPRATAASGRAPPGPPLNVAQRRKVRRRPAREAHACHHERRSSLYRSLLSSMCTCSTNSFKTLGFIESAPKAGCASPLRVYHSSHLKPQHVAARTLEPYCNPPFCIRWIDVQVLDRQMARAGSVRPSSRLGLGGAPRLSGSACCGGSRGHQAPFGSSRRRSCRFVQPQQCSQAASCD